MPKIEHFGGLGPCNCANWRDFRVLRHYRRDRSWLGLLIHRH
jgi:hypothetical protein